MSNSQIEKTFSNGCFSFLIKQPFSAFFLIWLFLRVGPRLRESEPYQNIARGFKSGSDGYKTQKREISSRFVFQVPTGFEPYLIPYPYRSPHINSLL